MSLIDCSKIDKCSETVGKRINNIKDIRGGVSVYRVINHSSRDYKIVDVENCVYKGNENSMKCDYAMVVENKFYFIELKGCDVKKAINQILSTHNDLKDCLENYTLKARIVPTKNKVPNLKTLKEYEKLKTLTKSDFIIKSVLLEEII